MQRRSAARTIAIGGALAGTVDGLAAIVNFLTVGGKDPLRIFHYIASGVFGTEAISGNDMFAIWGVVLHYAIATLWTAIFYIAQPFVVRVVPGRTLAGALYGLVVWAGMNLIVVPLSRVPSFAVRWPQAALAAAILVVCVGVPISFVVAWGRSDPEEPADLRDRLAGKDRLRVGHGGERA